MDFRDIISREDCACIFEGCRLSGPYSKEALEAAHAAVLDALRKQGQREQPLTLAELEATPDGEPVYIIHANGSRMSGWGIKTRDPSGHGTAYLTIQGGGREPIHSHYLRPLPEHYGETWTTYRARPEGRPL